MSAISTARRRLLKEGAVRLMVCDLQEAFRPSIHGMSDVLTNARMLVRAASILNIPTMVSEQHPKGLKHTVPEIKDVLPVDAFVYPKTKFSMISTEEIRSDFVRAGSNAQAVLCGIETHACILQTAIDLLNANVEVFIPVDAVSSQRESDSDVALKSLRDAGAVLTTSESVLLEVLRDSEHPRFRDISSLLKERNGR